MDVFTLLQSYLPDIVCHDEFINELNHLLSHDLSGKQVPFGKAVLQQLMFIKQFGRNIHLADSNELLKYTDKSNRSYCSIHLKRKEFNVRFLAYVDDKTYLLCAFYERSGKQKTSYQNYIPVLEKRLQDLKGG